MFSAVKTAVNLWCPARPLFGFCFFDRAGLSVRPFLGRINREVSSLIDENRLLQCFIELAEVESPSGGERQVADLLRAGLGRLGLAVREDDAGRRSGGNAGNLVVRVPGRGEPLLLCAHMDTVGPCHGVRARVADGVVRSAGDTVLGGDDKAGIAAIIEMLTVLIEKDLPHPPLEIVFTIWEEGGLRGADLLDPALLTARYGYTLDSEGPPGTIVTRAPSQEKLVFTVKGRAAHAGVSPEEGINAIHAAARGVAAMQLGRLDFDTTANIGIISGGQAINIVPDTVRLEGETRSLAGEKRERQTRLMVEAMEAACAACGAGLEKEVTLMFRDFNLAPESRPVRTALTAMRELGLTPALIPSGGGSDANIFNGRGIACANLGIGMRKVHTTEEHILVSDLVQVARILVRIAAQAAGGDR